MRLYSACVINTTKFIKYSPLVVRNLVFLSINSDSVLDSDRISPFAFQISCDSPTKCAEHKMFD